MQQLPGDDKGHLLASSLGGPLEDWNLAPQLRRLNRGDGSGVGWRNLENEIHTYLQKRCGYVHWFLVVGYLHSGSRRPNSFVVQATFYDTYYGQCFEEKFVTLDCHNDINFDGEFCSRDERLRQRPGH